MKTLIIKNYGGSIARCSEQLGISMQRISSWPEKMSISSIDRVIAALVRKGKAVPKWLLKP